MNAAATTRSQFRSVQPFSQPAVTDRSAAPARPAASRESSRFESAPRVNSSTLARLGSLYAPATAPAPRAEPQTVRAEATPDLAIQDNSKVESTLHIDGALELTGGSVAVDIPHTWRGDLVVTLTSPSGKSAVLHNRTGGSADDLKARFDLSAFAGEPTQGDWKLTVEDKARLDTGTLKSWSLELTGTPVENPEPPPPSPPTDDPFEGLRDQALLEAVRDSSDGYRVKGYSEARQIIFKDLDVGENGKVRCVYTGREIQGGRMPNSSDMNVEHTWPQSKGAKGTAKSDLHHLFPTDSGANSRRGNYPFGKVVNVKWSQNGAKLGTDAQGRTVFEPPDSHKGNVARAMFYFSATYGKSIPDAEEAVLKEWNHLDAVDADELERSHRIAAIQGNVNQFVEHSNLADRIRDF